MKGHMKDGKFHPHTEHKKGVRKSRDQSVKTEGIRLKRFDKTKIQTLIFPPSWSFSKVRSFLKRNNFKSTKVVKEGDRIRARQFPPSDIKRGGDCRTISLGNSSVQAVLCEVPIRKKRDPIIKGKIDLDQFFFIVKTLQDEGIAKEGMTSQQLVDIYNKRTGSTAKLGKRSGDINPNFKVFKDDKNRILENEKVFGK